MEKLRYGIAGCSSIAKTHIQALRQISNAEITAVFDRKQERAAAAAELAGPPAAVYTDYARFLADETVDAVLVLTASGVHAEMGIAAARAHKHVVVEKPIDITVEKARGLIAACREMDVKLSCIFQHRYDRDVQAVKAAIEDGHMGALYSGCCHTKWYRDQAYYDAVDWRGTKALDGGGALINQGIHQLDLFQYLLGDVEEVFAYCDTKGHKNIDVEDICMAVLRFRNGAMGLYETSTVTYPGYYSRIDVSGSEGSVILQDNTVREWHMRDGFAYESRQTQLPHREQLQEITDSILAGREPAVDGEAALKSLQIIRAIYASAKSGRPEKVIYENEEQ